MKSKVRFGILGAFVALAGAFGAVTSHKAAEQVDAQVPTNINVAKVCAAPTVDVAGVGPNGPTTTTNCTITVSTTNAGGASFVEPLILTVSPANTGTGPTPTYGRVRLLSPTSGGSSGASGAIVDFVRVNNPADGTPQTITVGCFGVGAFPAQIPPEAPNGGVCNLVAGQPITLNESVQGAVGGSTVETLSFQGGLFAVPFVAGSALIPYPGVGAPPVLVPVVINPSVTVNPATVTITPLCTPASFAAGSATVSNCAVQLRDNDIFPTAVSSGNIVITITGPAGTVIQTTGTTTSNIRCDNLAVGLFNAPQGCSTFSFNLVSNVGSVAGGTVLLQVNYVPDLATVDSLTVLPNNVLAPIATVTAVAVAGPATVAATSVCTPTAVTGTASIGAVGQIVVGTGAAGATTCVVSFTDGNAVPTSVSSANITVVVQGPAGVVFTSTGTTTTTVRCGVINTPEGCTSISLQLQSNTGSTVLGTISFNLDYQPDLPLIDLPGVINITPVAQVIAAPINIVALIQPAGLLITCISVQDANAPQTLPIQLPTPSQILAANLIAIGVLPSTISCTAVPVNAAGTAIAAVAPGVIEVSSTSGVIVDAQGRVSTDIPIGCDLGLIAAVNVIPGATINGNTCTGVAFRVAGSAVGNVELRARYLPSSASVVAGITERDTSATVGFVAPFVSVSLLLNPNPIAANGGTGVATARLNRTFNCSVTFGQSIAGGSACIDPTTGLPIVFNLGSSLNGTVLFNIDNTATAVWADAVSSTPLGSPQTQGFLATASQIAKRCGLFATAGFPNLTVTQPSFTGGLSNFFGGCESATATYRGVLPGTTNITATFVPDLPGAFGSAAGLTGPVASLFGFGGNAFNTSTRLLEVVAAAPSGAVQLSRGCNNVSPTVSEAASAYAARVTPQGALVAIWEHQAATNTFRGFSPQAGAPSDLASVTRLRPVFVCASGAATLDQPAA